MLDFFNTYFAFNNPLNKESIFLIFLAFVWIIAAVIQDFRKREVANWWNFSLIIFALAFRAFLSINLGNYWFFAWGLIGLGLGFILAELFYYARVFAGGDAKLLMALCTILPLSNYWKDNLVILITFLFAFLIAGAVYGIFYSIFLVVKNYGEFKQDFTSRILKYKYGFFLLFLFGIVLIILFLWFEVFIGVFLTMMLLVSYPLLIYAKSLEETCMTKLVNVRDLSVGDWTVGNIKIKNKIIRPNWEGLSENSLKLIKRYKKGKILVKDGVPFTPAFLFGFILLLLVIL